MQNPIHTQAETNIQNQKNNPIKSRWLIVFVGVIAGLMVFTQLYDIVIIRKSNASGLTNKTNNSALAGKVSNGITNRSIDVGDLDVDLDNLTEEDIASVSAFLKFKKIKAAFVPTGIPDVYGKELDVSFDQVQDAINKVRIFGPTYGTAKDKIALSDFTAAELERYKGLGASIACEYCCGVKTLTREDGTAACGCAHSQMMRGLSAYLIKNHPEVSDEWILNELAKWKVTYFPKQTLSVKLKELEGSGEQGIKELLQEFPDFLPQMVGGC